MGRFVSKDELQKLIRNAPPRVSPQMIMDELNAQGHQLEGYTPQAPTAIPSTPVTTMTGTNNPVMGRAGSLARSGAQAMVPVAGAIGGLHSPQLAGAMGGGAELGRQALMQEPLNPRRALEVGVAQGAEQWAGNKLAGGALKTGRWLMDKAPDIPMGHALKLREKGISIPRRMEKFGMTISEKSATKAGEMSRAAVDAKTQALSSAFGELASAKELASKLLHTARKNSPTGRLTKKQELAVIRQAKDEANRILTESTHGAVPRRGVTFNPREADMITMKSDKLAKAQYAPGAQPSSKDPDFSYELAAGSRAAVRRMVPGMQGIKREIIESDQTKKILDRSLVSKTKVGVPLMVGPVKGSIGISRKHASQLALLLQNPKVIEAARQSPRAAAEMIFALMGGYAGGEPAAAPSDETAVRR